jgi:hypothetical protein
MTEDFFHLPPVSTTPVVNLELRYLREFLKKFETALMVYSGAWGKLIREKNKKSKISWHCPFKSARGFVRETDTHRLSLPQILSSCWPFCGLNLIFSLSCQIDLFVFFFGLRGSSSVSCPTGGVSPI